MTNQLCEQAARWDVWIIVGLSRGQRDGVKLVSPDDENCTVNSLELSLHPLA